MTLLGDASVAMWWDVSAAHRAEFQDWHSHEHFPERMRIPGFQRGSRWKSLDHDDGFFVMYELASYDTLTSPHYLERLNDPTPWSVTMMPHHRNMVRSQCRTISSSGSGVAGFMLTIRLSPEPGRAGRLETVLDGQLRRLPERPGLTGAHLLQTQTPDAAATREQQIRGGDAAADWIVLVSGYDPDILRSVAANDLAEPILRQAGAAPGHAASLHRLCHSITPTDL